MADSSEPPAGVEADASASPGRRPPRPPSLLDALLPVIVLIGLLALTIAFFGIDATNGPLRVALLLSAAFASLIASRTATPSPPSATRPSGA
jgi:NhaC family Na+:H+ antiporter